MKLTRISLFCLAIGLLSGVSVARAEDLGAIKARMEQRVGTVDELKDRQVVGENNRGYLEARASLKPNEEKIVSDENADRSAVYQAIAQQTGSSADAVGRLRASKIASASKPGVWIQTPQGAWQQKH